MRGYRFVNRANLLAYLKSHPCVDCGETDPLLLEFDHRERNTKTGVVGVLTARKPWQRVLAEISKCDVRCVSCHRRRTAKQMKWHKALPAQLMIAECTPLQETARSGIESAEGVDATPNQCRGCGVTKSASGFPYRSKSRGTRQRRCRSCVAANSRRHYERNRETYKKRAHAGRRENRRASRERVIQYLLSHPCVDCGERSPILLDFDHRDRNVKTKAVGALLRGGTWTKIAREIEKCDVRCVRCHRRRTAHQFGWSKLAAA